MDLTVIYAHLHALRHTALRLGHIYVANQLPALSLLNTHVRGHTYFLSSNHVYYSKYCLVF